MLKEDLHPPYDAFMCFAGPDRDTVRELKGELQQCDVNVFFDENVPYFTSITGALIEALRNSKSLLVYYSREVTDRRACQMEMKMAFLAGQQQGNPSDRIIVINPESTTDHIFPFELRDDERLIQASGSTSLKTLVQAVRKRTTQIDDVMGDDVSILHPRWRNHLPGVYGFQGRYPEMWGLHSALTMGQRGFDSPHGPHVSLTGPAGRGKSALATSYGDQFGAAFMGGVYWTSLDQQGTTSDILVSYRRQAVELANRPELVWRSPKRATGELALGLATQEEPVLWIVDDIPSHFDPASLPDLLVPHPLIHSILLSRDALADDTMPHIEVPPLSRRDARAVLTRYRPAENEAERVQMDQLIGHLRSNAGALIKAGCRLEDMQGILSFADYMATVPSPEA